MYVHIYVYTYICVYIHAYIDISHNASCMQSPHKYINSYINGAKRLVSQHLLRRTADLFPYNHWKNEN